MSNEIALQKHEDKLAKKEARLSYMFQELDDRLSDLQTEINRILTISSDYDGYDFEEEMAEVLRDLL